MTLKTRLLATIAGALGMAVTTGSASAHNVLNINEGQVGHMLPITLNVNHGCGAEDVIGARLQIPEGILEAKAAQKAGWTIEYKYRTLDEPVMQHGRPITEVISEIYWKNPVTPMPANGWEKFDFRVRVPNMPGEVIYFKNITVCANETDPYVDVPEQALDINDPEFPVKAAQFMAGVSGPAPMFIIREATRGQYPWQWTPEQVRGEAPTQEAQAR